MTTGKNKRKGRGSSPGLFCWGEQFLRNSKLLDKQAVVTYFKYKQLILSRRRHKHDERQCTHGTAPATGTKLPATLESAKVRKPNDSLKILPRSNWTYDDRAHRLSGGWGLPATMDSNVGGTSIMITGPSGRTNWFVAPKEGALHKEAPSLG